jgi:hypothetical protein
MTEPDDRQLLEFIAMFVGWEFHPSTREFGWLGAEENCSKIPDYLNDLNAWHGDVWARIDQEHDLKKKWWGCLHSEGYAWDDANATARERCLALWRALNGKLPCP